MIKSYKFGQQLRMSRKHRQHGGDQISTRKPSKSKVIKRNMKYDKKIELQSNRRSLNKIRTSETRPMREDMGRDLVRVSEVPPATTLFFRVLPITSSQLESISIRR